ncbi:hypothetical protein BU23DRAFT_602914 [Bimuria novae-zelandiae CBS 107.79]|uniref:Ketosynthase family 3 (KS3) domain-containing protein n=1 Tax=Bimuria novae-zelandiae CBS 107.79 TaxID=1447943 RepID=A0A6A5URS9_9PLEO|nr:hypothetical protein BU23DRAFT_602914 [Bimuria novae-zelandiae CBS 107.79]
MSISGDKGAKCGREYFASAVQRDYAYFSASALRTSFSVSAEPRDDCDTTLSAFLGDDDKKTTAVETVAEFCALDKKTVTAHATSREGEIAMMSGNIAIVGIAGRWPGGDNTPEWFRELLQEDMDGSKVPCDRFDTAEYPMNKQSRNSWSHGKLLEGGHKFDPRFFNISPQETASLDPQHRIVMAAAYESLEAPKILSDDERPRSHTRTAVVMTGFIAAAGAALYGSSHAISSRSTHMTVPQHDKTTLDLPSFQVLRHLGSDILPLAVFTASTTTIYHLNRHHRYQDHFLLAGIVVGALVGMGVYKDLQDMMFKVVPWSILVALVSSMISYGGLERREKRGLGERNGEV